MGPGSRRFFRTWRGCSVAVTRGVERVTPWFGQLLVRLRGDNNCFFSSSTISCVLDAAMSLDRMTALVGKAQVVGQTDVYPALGNTPRYQAAVDSFLGYLAGVKRKLHSHSASTKSSESDTIFGASLGAKLVGDLTAKGGSHVPLYRGIVLRPGS